jgi:hypothetical protein
VVVRTLKVCWRGNGWAGWGWGAGRHCDDPTVFCNTCVIDLELQVQVEDSLTAEQRLVDGVLRRAGERRRKLKERGVRRGVRKGRGREKVEWRNREDAEREDFRGKVVFQKAVWRVE